MAKFRENPDAADDDEEEEQGRGGGGDSDSDSDSDDEDGATHRKKSSSKSREETPGAEKKVKKALGDDEESDDSYWGSDSDESTDSSSDDDPGMSLREKFLKKQPGDEKKKKEKKDKKDKKKLRPVQEEESDEDGEGWETVKGALEKPKMFDKDAEINHDLVAKKLVEIMAARGKKRTNRKEQIELLTELYSISEEHNLGAAIYCKIQFAIVSAIFDYNPKVSVAMKPEYWEKCMPAVEKVLQMIEENLEDLTINDLITDEEESFTEKPYTIRGCFLSVVERLDEEFIKVLKSCDAHGNEYVQRLKDEPRVVAILEQAQKLLELKSAPVSDICRIYLKRIEHVYFKFDPKVIQQKNVSNSKILTMLAVGSFLS